MTLPWWGTLALNWLVKLVTQWLADKRAEQALRDMGQLSGAAAARTEAERQEGVAHRAGAAAEDGPDDPRDLRKD